jgi:hypothetical protein
MRPRNARNAITKINLRGLLTVLCPSGFSSLTESAFPEAPDRGFNYTLFLQQGLSQQAF